MIGRRAKRWVAYSCERTLGTRNGQKEGFTFKAPRRLPRHGEGVPQHAPAAEEGEAEGTTEKGKEAVKRWLAFLCYTAILADGLFISFLIGTGGSLWAIPNTSVPMIVPPAVVFVGLIVAARRI